MCRMLIQRVVNCRRCAPVDILDVLLRVFSDCPWTKACSLPGAICQVLEVDTQIIFRRNVQSSRDESCAQHAPFGCKLLEAMKQGFVRSKILKSLTKDLCNLGPSITGSNSALPRLAEKRTLDTPEHEKRLCFTVSL